MYSVYLFNIYGNYPEINCRNILYNYRHFCGQYNALATGEVKLEL